MTPAEARRVRVLHVEDSDDDAELVRRELARGGLAPEVTRVETREALVAALKEHEWDVVISDHRLPTFSSEEAFTALRELNIDLPFIVVSGTIGEESAVASMRSGVHDFVLKDNLRRLPAAVARELREAEVRAEQRRTRQQLLVSERMASVGTLAAGVAHEINNPLAVVTGNLECLMNDFSRLVDLLPADVDVDADDEVDEKWPPNRSSGRDGRQGELVSSIRGSLEDMRQATERVRGIVGDLRLFSRSDDETRGPIDVRGVLDSSLNMAKNEIRRRASVVREYGNVPPVNGNEGRLGQVFLNLLVNAAQALPEGSAGRHAITVRTSQSGPWVVVEVSDTGSGIAPDVLPHIFDVFFTTKPVGVGTGLGLSICHRIVTSMGGEIAAESRIGGGTTMRVKLPSVREPAEASAPEPPAQDLRARRATILVVEDEEPVRRMLLRLLATENVTAVAGGREALARIAAGETYDLIVSDLIMPEMTGMELHAVVAERWPDLARRMLFVSGGTFTKSARDFLSRVENPRLDKPVDTKLLRRTIDAMLSSAAASTAKGG